jgi:Cdc6-like AAA superfamily ATPase
MNYLLNVLCEHFPQVDFTDVEDPFERLMKFFQVNRIIVYFRNAEVFAEETRQTFLYSLIDHINQFSINSIIVFSTRNINFTKLLEKRVKSRFNFKQLLIGPISFTNVNEII